MFFVALRRTVLLLALLPCKLAAQGAWVGQPCLTFSPENVITWPGHPDFGNPADFGRAVVAELNGDYSPDAVVVAGDKAVALFEPYVYDFVTPVTGLTGVVDVAVLAVGGPETKDVILATTSTGLESIAASDDCRFEVPVVIARGAWIGAGPLHVDDMDGDGADDVIAVRANGLSVLTRIGNGTGFPAGPTFSIGVPVFDARALDWGNDGSRELVVVAQDGLRVYSLQGPTLLDFVADASTYGSITPVRDESTEVLAWVSSAAGGGAELVVLNDTLYEAGQPLSFPECQLGPFTPTTILAGNYDDDGRDELLLAATLERKAIVLQNLSGGEPPPHFDPTDPQAYDVVTLNALPPTLGGVGIPIFGQLDVEGSDDVLAPLHDGSGKVHVFRTLPYQRTGTLAPPNSSDVLLFNTEYRPGTSPALGTLRQAFAVPNLYSTFTDVEIRIWRQTEPYALVDSVRFDRRLHALDMQEEDTSYTEPNQWVAIEVGFPTGECWPETQNTTQTHFYVDLRFRKTHATGMYMFSPKFIGGWTLGVSCMNGQPEQPGTYSYLESLGDPADLFGLVEHNGLDEGAYPPAETMVGAYLPITSVPAFQNGISLPGTLLEGAFPANAFDPDP